VYRCELVHSRLPGTNRASLDCSFVFRPDCRSYFCTVQPPSYVHTALVGIISATELMSFRVGNPPPRPRRASSSQAIEGRSGIGIGGVGARGRRVYDPDSGRLETLQRLHSRIERKITEYRHESDGTEALIERAQRLNGRMEVLKEKLRMCFRLSGEATPANLQVVLQQMADTEDPEDAPPDFICPITQCVMIDPVMTCDGKVYDRCAIVEWFSNFPLGQAPTSPLTNLQVENVTLVPREDIRLQIKEFLAAKASNEPLQIEDGSNGSGLQRSLDLHRSRPEEPSRRALAGPIWGSSVVPTSEENSRMLNMLRVDDTIDPESLRHVASPSAHHQPAPAPTQSGSTALSRAARPTAGGRAPIWGSSVVPLQEPNSRALNMLRMDDTVEIPSATDTTVPAPSPPRGGGSSAARHMARANNTTNGTSGATRRTQPPPPPAPTVLPAGVAAPRAGARGVPRANSSTNPRRGGSGVGVDGGTVAERAAAQQTLSLNLNARRTGRSMK
jgi:hypothetical protein